VRVDLLGLGFATMDRLHLQSMPEDKRHPFLGTQVGRLVLCDHAFDTDHKVLPIGHDGLKKGGRASWHIPVH
jgi:hypothetical protein